MTRERPIKAIRGIYIAGGDSVDPAEQNAILLFGQPMEDIPKLVDEGGLKAQPIAPGINLEWAGGAVVGLRLYPRADQGDVVEYERIGTQQLKDLKKISEWLNSAVRGLEKAVSELNAVA